MKVKKKMFNLFSKKSFLVLLVLALLAMISVPVIAQDTPQDKIESIKSYINENEVESLSNPLSLMLERRIDENNEISTDYIYALIDSYAEGEIETGEVYSAVNNLNIIQNREVSIDEIDQFTTNTKGMDNHGQVVSNFAQQLAEFAEETSEEDEENTGENVRAMAQELSNLAAENKEVSEENMISIKERRQKEIMNNNKDNNAKGKEMSEDNNQSNNYGEEKGSSSASEKGSNSAEEKGSENKPDNAQDKSENNPKN